MKYLIASTLLIILLLVTLIYIAYAVYKLKQNWHIVTLAWENTEELSRDLLIMGGLMFLIIPVLKGHPASDSYIAQVSMEMLPALAGSFFVVGVIAFIKEIREIRDNA